MSEIKPLSCPICDKEVSVALMGGEQIQWWSITRGIGKEKDRCTCRFFFESSSFSPDDPQEEKEAKKQRMIERWNTRKPMERIVERLKKLEKRYEEAWGSSLRKSDQIAFINIRDGIKKAINVIRLEA